MRQTKGRSGLKPYKFIGFGDIHGLKPYKGIGFGDIHGKEITETEGSVERTVRERMLNNTTNKLPYRTNLF